MLYIIVLDESIEICNKKKVEVKPTEQLVDRFCDFCNKSETETVGVFCEHPELYYEYVANIIKGCKTVLKSNFEEKVHKGFRWFFTKDIMNEELIHKLEHLQKEEDLYGGIGLEGMIYGCLLRNDIKAVDGAAFLKKMLTSELKWGLLDYNTRICSLLGNKGYSNEDACIAFPDGSIRMMVSYFQNMVGVIEIGNLWSDDFLTDAMIEQRVDAFREFLEQYRMTNGNEQFFCENVCSAFRVTKQGIFRGEELLQEF